MKKDWEGKYEDSKTEINPENDFDVDKKENSESKIPKKSKIFDESYSSSYYSDTSSENEKKEPPKYYNQGSWYPHEKEEKINDFFKDVFKKIDINDEKIETNDKEIKENIKGCEAKNYEKRKKIIQEYMKDNKEKTEEIKKNTDNNEKKIQAYII